LTKKKEEKQLKLVVRRYLIILLSYHSFMFTTQRPT